MHVLMCFFILFQVSAFHKKSLFLCCVALLIHTANVVFIQKFFVGRHVDEVCHFISLIRSFQVLT